MCVLADGILNTKKLQSWRGIKTKAPKWWNAATENRGESETNKKGIQSEDKDDDGEIVI